MTAYVFAMEYLRSQVLTGVPVVIAAGNHPFPFRTRKLSPPAPMVLGEESPGRVGHCRTKT